MAVLPGFEPAALGLEENRDPKVFLSYIFFRATALQIFQSQEKTRHPAGNGPALVFPVLNRVLANTQGFGQGVAGAESQGQALGFQFFGSHGDMQFVPY